MPIKDINKVINEPSCNKVDEIVKKSPKIDSNSITTLAEVIEAQEVNLNGKMMKFSESRKSPLTFTPMTFHSTPNKEGIPLTKTMVDQHLHPSRHSDNIKKTIEVHTDKPKVVETAIKTTELNEASKAQEADTSDLQAEDSNIQITIVENSQKVTETVKQDLSEKVNKVSGHTEQDDNRKNLATTISDGKECAIETTNEIKLVAEEKVICKKGNTEGNVKWEEIKDIKNEASLATQSLTATKASEEPMQRVKELGDNVIKQPSSKENADDESKNDKIIQNESEKNKECTEPESAENMITSDTSMNNVNKDALSHEITSETKVDKIQQLESKKEDGVQNEDLITQPTSSEQLELPSKVEVKTNRENAVADKNCQATKNDLPTKNKPAIDCNTTNITDDKCDKDTTDISLENKDIKHESNQPQVNVILNEKSKINDLNAPTLPVTESQIKTSICNESDMKARVQTDSIKIRTEENALSSAPKVKLNMESQSISKAAIEPSKTTIKDKTMQQSAALSLTLNQNINTESKSITKSAEDPPKIASKNSNVAPASLSTQIKQLETKKEAPKTKAIPKSNNCNSEVPFGKWTEAHRQEFLNKIKETKIPSNNSNTNQIKQTNDLNRRDVLKKFDSQRQSNATLPAKISEFGSTPKSSCKIETAAFVNKTVAIQQPIPVKPVIPSVKPQSALVIPKPAITKKAPKEEGNEKEQKEMSIIINSQELIDNTIEGIITRALKNKTTTPVHMKGKMSIHTVENPKDAAPLPGSLDDIEMKMNELHGFSYMERAVTELSQTVNHDIKPQSQPESIDSTKSSKIPCLLPFNAKEQQKTGKETTRVDTSDEEIIGHEPITGDIDVSKQNLISLLSCKETFTDPKKDAIITEKDFDKFARRNSKTYENCLTVNFDKEKHNVVQTVVEKETSVKKLSRNELLLAESKAKSSNKHHSSRHLSQTSKIPTLKTKHEEDSYNKSYQSKVQIAYQSALTAKRNLDGPIPIIEEKPVKVVFMDTNTEYTPAQLNVQGPELSPLKNPKSDSDVQSASESLDSDVLDSSQDSKPQDDKSRKHQRKQVLTPVQEPEMELIEPSDLGIKVSPTKKRKIEEKPDKTLKNLVPKKSYLLNRSVVDSLKPKSDQSKPESFTGHVHSALDNLVKAAELIENQSETNKSVTNQTNTSATSQPDTSATSQSTETPQNTPVKRGRGRPRKYPLPEPGSEPNKTPSPQKRPRLIDAKPVKTYSDSEESSDGEIVKENWTMGKINENIVCPICSKLFRSEDVLFKHVKHCTGPSPNRSDSDKRSPRRLRNSQDSERKLRDSISDNMDSDTEEEKDVKINNRDSVSKTTTDIEDVIVIEDTPVKQKPDAKVTYSGAKRGRKPKYPVQNLICEFCGKTFRQLSYLDSHKLQHKKDNLKDAKNVEDETIKKSIFSCEVCTKEFRKLHHLVQHRIIHNPSSMASRSLRKTSSEVHESKNSKTQNDDASAGFRCEPCDKSFRKLHHLVEHRETHDGINKKGSTSTAQAPPESSKSVLAHHCDVCKKDFKKLQDLLDHKEQHYETSSEKSDDKSVKSSLSTKDIIHECSLCYMVFPNEHSLTKHTVICLRKKKQSAAKQAAKQAEVKEGEEAPANIKSEDGSQDTQATTDIQLVEDSEVTKDKNPSDVKPDQAGEQLKDTQYVVKEVIEVIKHNVDVKPSIDAMPKKRHSNASDKSKADDVETPAKIKKIEIKERVICLDTPTLKKKTNKDKIPPTVPKRQKKNDTAPGADSVKPMESSDEDEIRYMLNPNFKEEESNENKIFMKISALKRNSLQIERPSSNDLVKRRTSLQNPPKMPRLKAKPVEVRPRLAQVKSKAVEKKLTPVAEQTTDSDDSDVKYSFPEQETNTNHVEKKVKRQSVGLKRKSLVGIAKRKSLGKPVTPKGRPKKRKCHILSTISLVPYIFLLVFLQ